MSHDIKLAFAIWLILVALIALGIYLVTGIIPLLTTTILIVGSAIAWFVASILSAGIINAARRIFWHK